MIPVFVPEVLDSDVEAVVAALRKGEISGSFGSSIAQFEQAFAAYCGVAHGVAVSSGTAALHLSVAALDLEPGSEILVSASTNVATALAVHHNGHVVAPVDSERRTWNLDLDVMESLIDERTRAVIPVHLFGHPVDMDRLMGIADRYSLAVIEDCAESHGATCRGRMTGSFGQMACFSFYANKVITTGEGGMVLTDDPSLAERLRLLRNLAFTQPRFRHEVAGFNFRMTAFQAAMGVAQLDRIDQILAAKRKVAETYAAHLAGVESLQLPLEEEWAHHVYWMYPIVVRRESAVGRDVLMEALSSAGFETRTFFCPMNQQPFLMHDNSMRVVPCPVADELWETGLYLPSSTSLDAATIQRIADVIKETVSTSGS